jgi:methionyl-tRNA formyltransferase
MGERPSPVHEEARALGIAVFTRQALRDPAEQAAFAALRADAAVVVAYGLLLPPPILQAPREGCFNLHASLLPRWRGAAPIQRAIMAGDRETGIMLMRMDEGLDTGPVCLAERVPIGSEETAGALSERLARLGADLVVRGLAALERGELTCAPQAEAGATYARKIHKSETRIDWTRPAGHNHDQIRALSPSPGAWCEVPLGGGPERLKILRSRPAHGSGAPGTVLSLDPLLVACGAEALELLELQRAGRKPAGAGEFLRGARLAPGARLA